MKRMSAEQAAEIIQHDDMVAFSGLPRRVRQSVTHRNCQRACEQHQNGQPFQIRLLTGASIGAAADDVLSAADTVSWRAPYQTSSALRDKINQGR
ncbi:hypothetical protein ACNKHK_18600 [Shigella flexneri]